MVKLVQLLIVSGLLAGISGCGTRVSILYPSGALKARGRLNGEDKAGKWNYYDEGGELDLVVWYSVEKKTGRREMEPQDYPMEADSLEFEDFHLEDSSWANVEFSQSFILPDLHWIRKVRFRIFRDDPKPTTMRIRKPTDWSVVLFTKLAKYEGH